MLQKQALQSKFIDGTLHKKKTGPEGPRRTTHHTQHAVTNRRAHHFIELESVVLMLSLASSALGAPGRNKRSEVSITGPGGAQPLMVTNSPFFSKLFSTGILVGISIVAI